jgi:ketosteroid isomerase-like protein
MKGRAATGALVVSILIVAGGCGLFKPRDPRPGGGAVVPCATPNSPNDVVTNILNHYADALGVGCYVDMLDDSFAFHPDLTDSSEAIQPNVFVNWNKSVEDQDARAIANKATSRTVVFDSLYANTIVSPDQRTVIRFYQYHLIVHPAQSTDTLFQGRADITFFQGGNGQWHVTSWVDKRDGSGARTWGYLREINRVGF